MKPGVRPHVQSGTNFKNYRAIGSLKALLFCLFTGMAFSSHLLAQEKTPPANEVRKKNAVEDFEVTSSYGKLPALWHIRMTGADWAKVALQKAGFKKARVIVMDDRIDVGAEGEIERPVRTPRMAKVRLLVATRPDLKTPEAPAKGILNQLFSYFKVEEREAVDAREFVVVPHDVHGTHVAGTIGAQNPLYGVSPAASVYSLPIFDYPTYTLNEDAKKVIDFIADNEKDSFILNMSLEFAQTTDYLSSFQRLLSRPEVAASLSSGNSGKLLQADDLRCQLPEAVVVGAAAPTGTLAMFSNYGDCIDLIAPGVGVLSRGDEMELDGEQLSVMQGTSMAAPMVTGAMANLRAVIPALTAAQMKMILLKTAWDLDAPGKDQNTGNGMINILKATVAAIRLRDRIGKNPAAIDYALENPELYDTEQMALSSELEISESCLGCPSRIDDTFRMALLSNDTHRMPALAKLPENKSNMLKFGYQYMAYNRVDAQMSSEEITKFSKMVISYQNSLMGMRREAKIFQSLANPEVILKVAESFKGRKDLQSLFQTRLAMVAPEQIPNLKLAMMSDEEKKAISNQSQVVMLQTEPSPDPAIVCLPGIESLDCPGGN